MPRLEKDSLGSIAVPDEALYGIQTARALENFPVSGLRARPEFIRAYAAVKKAAALVNVELGALRPELGRAIVMAADEVLGGDHHRHFVVDVYQAGAGTSFNMNVNEVLANRALEILGRERGDYEYLGPNDHVNMAQSSNDTFPTACHIAAMDASRELVSVLGSLAAAFRARAVAFAPVAKSGRTHLADALPVTLGSEFGAWGAAVERAAGRLDERRADLAELPIGGTATGTGANTLPGYRYAVIARLSQLCHAEFRPARDSYEALQSRSQLVALSSALRELALELIRIANDLRLLASGPASGLAEIRLPAVQPGSSMMPGKVNPVLAECLNMVCFQVVGNDTVVMLAGQAGQLELNVMTPVIIHNILSSIALLTNCLPVFTARCVEGVEADEKRCRALLLLNPALATLISPRIGYLRASELAREALERGIPVAELAVEQGLLDAEEAARLLDPGRAARGPAG